MKNYPLRIILGTLIVNSSLFIWRKKKEKWMKRETLNKPYQNRL
jgi:hypothetical protein